MLDHPPIVGSIAFMSFLWMLKTSVPGDGHETVNKPFQDMLHVEITFQSGSGAANSHLPLVLFLNPFDSWIFCSIA